MKKLGTILIFAGVFIAGAVEYWREQRITIPASPSVVVLPATVPGDAGDGLAAAVANTLSKQLAEIANVDIKAPPTSTQFEQLAGNGKRVSLAYDANLIVAPAITEDGDNLHLDLQLLNPVTENVLWHRVFDGSRSQYLDL